MSNKGAKRAKYLAKKRKKERKNANRKVDMRAIIQTWQHLVALATSKLVNGTTGAALAQEMKELFVAEDENEQVNELANVEKFTNSIQELVNSDEAELDSILKAKLETEIKDLRSNLESFIKNENSAA